MKLGEIRFMLTLPKVLKTRIEKEAEKRAIPQSSLIRLAIYEWLESKKERQVISNDKQGDHEKQRKKS